MNRNELLEQLKELKEKEYKACDDHNGKLAMKFNKQATSVIVELEKIDGIIWSGDEWITSIHSKLFNSQEEARQDLLNKISSLPGVTVIDGDKGVKFIQVLTATKIYDYEIHAHIENIQVGVERVKSIFKGFDDYDHPVYIGKWIASIGKNTFNAYRNEYTNYLNKNTY